MGLTDRISEPLFQVATKHPSIKLITVTQDSESFAIAAGLWIGGASPFEVIRNTGLLESGEVIRATVLRMATPIPMLVTGCGHDKMTEASITPEDLPTMELLSRSDVDSAAVLTEPTLAAWGIPFSRCGVEDDPVAAISQTINDAQADQCAGAVIMARSLP